MQRIMASLRTAFPRAGLSLHSKQLQQWRLLPAIRHSSSTPKPPKPRVLEKPDKFRAPSHPARIQTKPKYQYGPDLSPQQKTKRYPHMMPEQGTFLHWFLTNRFLHAWITFSVLFSLVIFIWLSDFLHQTPYRDLLPPNSMFWAHPFQFLRRWTEVYQMHVEYTGAKTAEMRKQKVEDVQKKAEYRKAHGIEEPEGVFGGWTAKSSSYALNPSSREGDIDLSRPTTELSTKESETYVDFSGKEQPAKKKWLGIW